MKLYLKETINKLAQEEVRKKLANKIATYKGSIRVAE